MNKKITIPFLLAGTILVSSCASILNGKKQSVVIDTDSNNAKVYIDKEEVGEGNKVTSEIKRDMIPHQIRIEKEGYKDEYFVAYQYKKSPWYIMSVVPFGVLLYPLVNDMGPKSWNFDKEIIADRGSTKLPERKEDEKEIVVGKTKFDISKSDATMNLISGRAYKKKDKINVKQSQSFGGQGLQMENTIFSKAIYELLSETNYVDTTATLLKSRASIVNLEAEVKNMEVFNAARYKRGHSLPLHFVELGVIWKVSDVYGQSVFEKKINGKSGDFAYFFSDKTASKSVKDALQSSLASLLEDDEFKEILQGNEFEEEDYDLLTVSDGNIIPNDINEAMKASCTIKNKDGHGSGFVIGKEGYVLTNFHVVADKKELKVIDDKGLEHEAEVIRYSQSKDLALLKVDHQFENSFKLKDANEYKRGLEVFAIGTPTSVELGQSLTKGIISGIRENEEVKYIQIDASINSGNSGGPLITTNGELIGVVNAKVKGLGIEGLGFVIPAEEIQAALNIN
ncbi:MAG: trypsin-like peptidase domain-containing protein [Bacteroidota bacterium]